MNAPMQPHELAAAVVARDRVAIAAALSLVEDRRDRCLARVIEFLRALRQASSAHEPFRVGLTGPPGAGKSSLVATMTRHLRARGLSVGVLAIDPTSPRSGGAFLGDRARIGPDPEDNHIFVRSMASGGDLGGLARAAYAAADVLSAAFDLVIIETVGVGQSETDIEFVADTTALVMQPASGDVLQFLKAGILEIPDLFVINKYDLGPPAERTRRELAASIKTARAAGLTGSEPVVIAASAQSGTGIEQLIDALLEARSTLKTSGQLQRRRLSGAVAWSERLVRRRVGEAGIEALGGATRLRALLEQGLADGKLALEVAAHVADRALASLCDYAPTRS